MKVTNEYLPPNVSFFKWTTHVCIYCHFFRSLNKFASCQFFGCFRVHARFTVEFFRIYFCVHYLRSVLSRMLQYCFVDLSRPSMPNIVHGMHVNFDGKPFSTSRGINFCTWLLFWRNNIDCVQIVVCPPRNVSKTLVATGSVHKVASVRDKGGNPVFVRSRAGK